MEALEQFLKTSEPSSNYICIISINYLPLILDVVRVITFHYIFLRQFKIQVFKFNYFRLNLYT